MRVQVSGVPKKAVWVGQKVSLNVKVLLTERPKGVIRFDVPEADGGVFLQLPESPFFTTENIEGVSFTGYNFTFLLYPHRAGTSKIPAMGVRVGLSDGTQLDATAEAIEVTAQLPKGGENLRTLISTKDLRVTESWSPGRPEDAKVGDAFTREITIEAVDVLGMGFPALPLTASDTLRIYPKAPQTMDRTARGEITGTRIETAVYLCQREGEGSIPKLVIPWLKLGPDSPETIELPAHTFRIAPNPAAVQAAAAASGVATREDALSPAVIGAVAILVILGLLGWWLGPRLGHRIEEWWAERQAAEPAVFRRLVIAIEETNWKHYHTESRQWLRALPGELPRSLLQFAEGAGDEELSTQLGALLGAQYGSQSENPADPKALIRALKRVRHAALQRGAREKVLPPLNPSGASR